MPDMRYAESNVKTAILHAEEKSGFPFDNRDAGVRPDWP